MRFLVTRIQCGPIMGDRRAARQRCLPHCDQAAVTRVMRAASFLRETESRKYRARAHARRYAPITLCLNTGVEMQGRKSLPLSAAADKSGGTQGPRVRVTIYGVR